MSFKTTIQPSNHAFPIEKDETILEAALDHGLTLPYSCRNGACGVCKGKVVSGSVDHGKAQAFALSEEEKAAGMALFCCAKPLSDLVIESHEVTTTQEIVVKTLPCRVEKMVKLADEVMALYLKLPANERLQFLSGQYIDILQKDGKPRSFSLANAPHADELLELHVRNIPGGTFTQHVFNEMKERDILRIKGPLGTFFLHEDSPKPIIFVASGTGFAPVKAIIEHALHIGFKREMHFYWGVRMQSDLYMLDKVKEWEAQGIRFMPVVSDEPWSGRTGFVHQAVMDDFRDLSGYAVYACGAPVVVQAAHRDFTSQRRLAEDSFYSDMFTFVPKS
ncbi:MAG: CDP-6-deoxy-delta-3,4-glucoseen reductase [Gammaproteobacteria bacterium]|nr:CDP-6-deoxy-delta-3,4-glucoseen reductase [Gammaproteobacteria bacterium]MBU1775917.1 CDP-6-deoxy-delta-3,4-glucoseen reductase [Gammaproteobacteria bacterium]MBU1968148.1 CDP-6-deoxy-delta-3,4-glucoseen reductase [Gammaproteobacteria bacterium]